LRIAISFVLARLPANRGSLTQRTARTRIDKINEIFSAEWLDVGMRFLMTLNGGGPAPDQRLHEEMGRFVEELTRAGVLLATGGLDPSGVHFTASNGKVTLVDGPYAEAKETIVSFALIDVRSKEEAVELSKRFWAIVRDGEGDMRQVYGPDA
jgi:hypothetical protein